MKLISLVLTLVSLTLMACGNPGGYSDAQAIEAIQAKIKGTKVSLLMQDSDVCSSGGSAIDPKVTIMAHGEEQPNVLVGKVYPVKVIVEGKCSKEVYSMVGGKMESTKTVVDFKTGLVTMDLAKDGFGKWIVQSNHGPDVKPN